MARSRPAPTIASAPPCEAARGVRSADLAVVNHIHSSIGDASGPFVPRSSGEPREFLGIVVVLIAPEIVVAPPGH